MAFCVLWRKVSWDLSFFFYVFDDETDLCVVFYFEFSAAGPAVLEQITNRVYILYCIYSVQENISMYN